MPFSNFTSRTTRFSERKGIDLTSLRSSASSGMTGGGITTASACGGIGLV